MHDMNDFPTEANCPEPWKTETQVTPIGNGLVPQGGEVKLTIDVHDYQGKGSHAAPIVECPELFDGAKDAAWISDGSDFSSWEIVLGNEEQAPAGDYKCLIKVVDNENAGSPAYLDLTAYGIVTLIVAPWSPGSLIWAKSAGGAGSDAANRVTALPHNSSVVVGGFSDSAAFGQGEANETVLSTAGMFDVFIARYFPDGTLRWAKSAGGTNNDWANGIAALSDGSTVVTGTFGFPGGGTATFGQGEANQTELSSAGGYDIFVARYNADGTLAWAKRAGGTDCEMGCAVTALSDNSTVVIGFFKGSATFGKLEPNETELSSDGDYDIFIARYNPDGTLAWAKGAGGTEYDNGMAITALWDDFTAVAGLFMGPATFEQGEPNEAVLTSAGYEDIFVAKYDPSGTFVWAKCAGGAASDWPEAIAAPSNFSVVVTGRFAGSATFGEGEPDETELNSAGDSDLFIASFCQ